MKIPELPAELIDFKPDLGLILGSGLGFFADDRIEVVGRLPYAEIEGFPVSTVPGHAGQFVFGHLNGRRVICMQGRFHFYEGYRMDQLILPIRMMHQLGVQTLFVTNAAGGINPCYVPGDFMLIHDHINFLGTNPLIGATHDEGVRFPDMSEVYDKALRHEIRKWARSQNIRLQEGIYLATTGPSFETPAEIRAFATLGADAVGMSTVPEAIVARQLGIRVIGISCITNAAAGISCGPLSHEEVSETADRVRVQFAELLTGAIALS
ncbi:MAG: purine-nucleoside phosphorylase [Lentimonas sp.]|jgi:purine-nucleoside phosphorylase